MNLASLVDGYAVGKLIHAGARSQVYEATRETDGLDVVLKVYSHPTRGPERAQHEFDAIRACAHPRTSKAVELLPCEVPVLVLERIPGRTLGNRIDNERLELGDALRMAVELAVVLESIHAVRIVHRDITPSNVILHAQTGEAHLIDFDVAIPIGHASQDGLTRKVWLAGTPLYLAPEQTGWATKGCDARTDLYTLGATLYHALTGQPPFVEQDSDRLKHAQVYREPVPPHVVRSEIPTAVSQVVLKLLRKDADDRYPNARTLRADLEQLLGELRETGRIGDGFVPGMSETPDRPYFPSRIYGRARELERIANVFDDLMPGPPRVLLLRGRAGAGKTALLEAARPAIATAGGYLAAGQFHGGGEQPYAAWIAAMRALLSQILVESEDSFQSWREVLRDGLGNIAGALVDLIPDLAVILPDTLPVPAVGPRQAFDRLALAFERLIRACSMRAQPLAILLDDLQWSDAGSLVLLQRILRATDLGPLVLLGAFRSEDVGPQHPLTVTLEELHAQSIRVEILDLGRIAPDAALEMLSDALGRSPDEVRPLAGMIERATDNTPLLIREFVDHVHARGLLEYDGGWTWDDAAIDSTTVPESAAELMAAKIDRLAPEPQRLLAIASCMPEEFDLERLTGVTDSTPAMLEPALGALSDAGLLIASPGGFRFAHDRIRQASQARCSPEERAQHHFRIGCWLLDRDPDIMQKAGVFEVANHLNRAGPRVPDAMRWTLIQLNLRAGQRALASGASADAARYLEAAHRGFAPDDWRAHPALGFELQLDWVESLIQTGEYTRALGLLEDLDERRTSRIEFARIADKRIYIYGMTRPLDESLRYALGVLGKLGMRWPLCPSLLRVKASLAWLQWQIGGRKLEDVLHPDPAPDPDRLAPLLVLRSAGGLLGRFDGRLTALVTASMLRICLRHGYPTSPGAFVGALALWVQAFLRNDARVRALAESAMTLVERFPDPIMSPRTEFTVRGLVEPWYTRRRRSLRSIRRAATLLAEAGDPEFENYARYHHALYRVLAGDPVEDVEHEIRELVADIQRSGKAYEDSGQMLRAYALLGLAREEPERIEQEAAAYERFLSTHPHSVEPIARTVWLMVFCIHRRFDLAFAFSESVVRQMHLRYPFVYVADHMLYRGLAAAYLGSVSRGLQRYRHARALRRCRERLRRWARSGPDFRHMALLLDAEHAGLRGQSQRALHLYREAALIATDQRFMHHVALAQEQRGRLLVRMGRVHEAGLVLEDAGELYAGWGARAKADALAAERVDLQKRFPSLARGDGS